MSIEYEDVDCEECGHTTRHEIYRPEKPRILHLQLTREELHDLMALVEAKVRDEHMFHSRIHYNRIWDKLRDAWKIARPR